jgi:hypothetical protein
MTQSPRSRDIERAVTPVPAGPDGIEQAMAQSPRSRGIERAIPSSA